MSCGPPHPRQRHCLELVERRGQDLLASRRRTHGLARDDARTGQADARRVAPGRDPAAGAELAEPLAGA
jgi:hypothetical protein